MEKQQAEKLPGVLSNAMSRLALWSRINSPWLVHFNSGSCNGCDIEILATLAPRYDLERFGVKLQGSPRHADMLICTGPVTRLARSRLLRVYEQMPAPKFVIAVGSCSITGRRLPRMLQHRRRYRRRDPRRRLRPGVSSAARGDHRRRGAADPETETAEAVKAAEVGGQRRRRPPPFRSSERRRQRRFGMSTHAAPADLEELLKPWAAASRQAGSYRVGNRDDRGGNPARRHRARCHALGISLGHHGTRPQWHRREGGFWRGGARLDRAAAAALSRSSIISAVVPLS